MINLQALLQGVPDISMAPPPPANWQETVGPVNPNQYLVEQVPPVAPKESLVSQPAEPEITAKGLDLIQNKGLFGVKGTLRDILGVLGDGLTGRDNYSQLRRQERYGNILAGKYQDNAEESFMANPELALQRLTEEGFGKEAQQLYQQMQANQIAQQKEKRAIVADERDAENDTALKAVRRAQEQKAIQDIVARTYRGIGDEKVLTQINQWAKGKLEAVGLNAASLPQTLDAAKKYSINPYQLERLDDYDKSIDIQEDRADTYRSVARPRSETSVELFERYSNIPANRRTPEQQAFIKQFTQGRGKKERREGTIPGAAPQTRPPARNDRPGAFPGEIRTSRITGITEKWETGKGWVKVN